MKLKSPTEPVLLSDKSFSWLEQKLKKNESRRKLNEHEKELCAGAKEFESQVKSLMKS